jgi:hypothetical protein
MLQQCTSSLLLVRPEFFRSNDQTSLTNNFQHSDAEHSIHSRALEEFEHVAFRLKKNGIYIHVHEHSDPNAPDAVFPNNWISFHENRTAIIYPMLNINRRKEKNQEVIRSLQDTFQIENIIDLSYFEKENIFLEGTGSLVFDHKNKTGYASVSPRTSAEAAKKACNILGYKLFIFHSEIDDQPVYHTNVILNIGEKYAVVCLDSVADTKERNDLRRMLAFTGHEVICISVAQVKMFAGNMLEIYNDAGKHFTLLSSNAIKSLHLHQINTIGEFTELLTFDVSTFEKYGGGGIRCMVAEIFCPLKAKV